MAKFHSDVTKKWFKYAILNLVVLIMIFGVLILTYGIMANGNNIDIAREEVQRYSGELAELGYSKVKDIVDGNIAGYENILRKDCLVGIYEYGDDNTLIFDSNDKWLKNSYPLFTNKDHYVGIETIGNKEFMTSHSIIRQSGVNNNAYVKVFMSMELINRAKQAGATTNAIYIAVFILVSVVLSVGLAYLEVRPLVKSAEEQRQFINDISHEIRTPLTVIKGNVENIMAKPECSVKEVNDELYDLLNEVEYMTEMTTGMLTIVRNSNKANNTKDANISDIVRSVIDIYGELTGMSQRALIASIDNVSFHAGKDKIKQLLMILLDNALKYTEEGDKIIVKLKSTPKGCLLTVSDTGIGVAENELDKIFDRFYRAKNAETLEGTGLGLSIAKSIVESYNGTIGARQNIPKGLIISVELNETN